MSVANDNQIKAVALELAKANAKAEPNLTEIYWFPDDKRVRLLEVDSTAHPTSEVLAFYFGPDLQGGMPLESGIALIRPEEVRKVSPPDGWGSWEDAVLIWSAVPDDR